MYSLVLHKSTLKIHSTDYKFNQILKESVYITLLSNIIAAVDQPCEVVFDGFGKNDFENNIVSAFSNDEAHL